MKKIIKVAFLMLTVMLFACGCGGKKDKAVSIDAAKLAAELNEKCVTSASLTAAADNVIKATYFITDDQIERYLAGMK